MKSLLGFCRGLINKSRKWPAGVSNPTSFLFHLHSHGEWDASALFGSVFKEDAADSDCASPVCDWEAQHGPRSPSWSFHIWSLLGDWGLQLLLREPAVVYISASKIQNGPLLGMNHFISWPLQARLMSLLFVPRCSPARPCYSKLCFASFGNEQETLTWMVSISLVEGCVHCSD